MNVPTEPWLHPDVDVRQSPIEGNGLFAATDLPEGVVVAAFGGTVVSDAELAKLIDEADDYVDTPSIDVDQNLVMPGRSNNGYGNHGCDPNLWWTDELLLTTRRAVAAGDELLLDYGTITGDSGFGMPCECGAQICRGEVTGRDWQIPALQRAYGDHWSPALRHRVREAT